MKEQVASSYYNFKKFLQFTIECFVWCSNSYMDEFIEKRHVFEGSVTFYTSVTYNIIQNWIMGTILNPAIYMFVKLKYQT